MDYRRRLRFTVLVRCPWGCSAWRSITSLCRLGLSGVWEYTPSKRHHTGAERSHSKGACATRQMIQQQNPPPNPPSAVLGFESAGNPLTVAVQPRNVRFFFVADYELTLLRWVSPSLPLAFFGISISTAIAFGTIVNGPGVPPDRDAVYAGLTWASIALSVFFGILTIGAWIFDNQLVKAIKERPASARV